MRMSGNLYTISHVRGRCRVCTITCEYERQTLENVGEESMLRQRVVSVIKVLVFHAWVHGMSLTKGR